MIAIILIPHGSVPPKISIKQDLNCDGNMIDFIYFVIFANKLLAGYE
jgi:hypothetical protein